jgi:hypothetical protein
MIETATVLVGPERTRFLILKDLACVHSPFFAAALRGDFAEAHSNSLTLPDIDPKIFEHVVLWLYQQRLDPSPRAFYKDSKPTYFTLLDIYAVADQLCIEGLRNAVVDLMGELADKTNSVPTPTDTNLLYENIRENAPIRQLVIDLFAYKKTDNLLATHPDPWHPLFLRDLTCLLKRPGTRALTRHDLRPHRPKTSSDMRGCEVCKKMVGLNRTTPKCSGCSAVFCVECVNRAIADEGPRVCDWSAGERGCKPWGSRRGRCEYHEHRETEGCKLESWDSGVGGGGRR